MLSSLTQDLGLRRSRNLWHPPSLPYPFTQHTSDSPLWLLNWPQSSSWTFQTWFGPELNPRFRFSLCLNLNLYLNHVWAWTSIKKEKSINILIQWTIWYKFLCLHVLLIYWHLFVLHCHTYFSHPHYCTLSPNDVCTQSKYFIWLLSLYLTTKLFCF